MIGGNSGRQSLSRNIPSFSNERVQTSVEKKHNFKPTPTPVRSGRKSGFPNSTMIQFTPSNLMPREPVRFTTIKQLSTERAQMSTPIKRQKAQLEQVNNNGSESARKKYLISTDSISQKRNDRYIPERTSLNERDIDEEREALL